MIGFILECLFWRKVKVYLEKDDMKITAIVYYRPWAKDKSVYQQLRPLYDSGWSDDVLREI